MIALTFSTGIADAAGYLALDKVFTGNMTGNVVILGMALGQADGLPVLGPAVALTTFMAGAAVGGRVLRAAGPGWTPRVTVLLLVVALIMAACTIGALVDPIEEGTWQTVVLAGLLAGSMGMQAAAARRVAVPDVTTVVVTSTITAWASESRLAGGRGQPWARRSAAVVSLVLGAFVGALLLRWGLALCLGLAVLVVLLSAVAGHVAHGRERRRLSAPAIDA